MSSLCQEKNGRWVIHFKSGDKRTSLRLGELSKTRAVKMQTFIDEILEHQRYGTQPHKESEVAKWLSNLSSKSRKIAERLERVGLLTVEPSAKLGEYLESFINRLVPQPIRWV